MLEEKEFQIVYLKLCLIKLDCQISFNHFLKMHFGRFY